MKFAHYAEMSVFIKEEKDEQKIRDLFTSLLPFKFEDEEAQKKAHFELEDTIAKGLNESDIKILKIKIHKESYLNQFIKNLFSHFSDEQKEWLKTQLERCIDEKGNLYLRLDLDKLLNGEFWICDSGNCFHIRINLATYPKTKDRAIEVASSLLK